MCIFFITKSISFFWSNSRNVWENCLFLRLFFNYMNCGMKWGHYGNLDFTWLNFETNSTRFLSGSSWQARSSIQRVRSPEFDNQQVAESLTRPSFCLHRWKKGKTVCLMELSHLICQRSASFLAKNCSSRMVNSHTHTLTQVTLNILLGYPQARMCVWAEQGDQGYFCSAVGAPAGLPALALSCRCVNIET